MGFWSNLLGTGPNHEGITPNQTEPPPDPGTVGETGWTPGDPDGVEFEGEPVEMRSLAVPQASPWSGYPSEWSTPNWTSGGTHMNRLVDAAETCIDYNASILATLPAYRMADGQTAPATTWMGNPDPLVYTDWTEFAEQLFWDYQLGEAFVLATSYYAETSKPRTFRVIPPWLVQVDHEHGQRTYSIGGHDYTDDMLHLRYRSTTDLTRPRGTGPLDGAGGQMLTSAVLQRYIQRLAETGGRPLYWLSSEQRLTQSEVEEMQRDFIRSRERNLGEPPVFGKGTQVGQAAAMSAKDMALLELTQWSDARIAVKLKVPPVLVGLPSGGDSMTYANVSQLFQFHERAGLRTLAGRVMPALSRWLLPSGQSIELNRDEYSRPDFRDRADGYKVLVDSNVMHPEEARAMERLNGPAPKQSAVAGQARDAAASLTGGDQGE